MRALGLIVVLAAACTTTVGGTPHDNSDGGFRTGGGDDGAASIDAMPDVMVDADICPNARQVYLNFQGQALVKASNSDATQNYVSWTSHNNFTLPPWRQNDGDRDNKIADVTAKIKALLSPYKMTVVTDRPAAGPYVMIVFGGDQSTAGSQWNITDNQLDCNDQVENDVAWVSDGVTGQNAADWAVSAIGRGVGLDGTDIGGDCMQGWGFGAGSQGNSPCTFGNGIENFQQCGQVTQDEDTAMMGFCTKTF